MVKDHSYSKRVNLPMPMFHYYLLAVHIFYVHHITDRTVHTMACYTNHGALAGMRSEYIVTAPQRPLSVARYIFIIIFLLFLNLIYIIQETITAYHHSSSSSGPRTILFGSTSVA